MKEYFIKNLLLKTGRVRKEALYLCSYNIKEGDKNVKLIIDDYHRDGAIVFDTDNNIGAYYKEELLCANVGPTPVGIELNKDFKVIGKVSKKATWVTEGDELDEIDFMIYHKHDEDGKIINLGANHKPSDIPVVFFRKYKEDI